MKVALVTGVAGQDGCYLAELLLARGYRVIGAVPDPQTAYARLPAQVAQAIELIAWDMSSEDAMGKALRHYRPAEVYNLAAHASGMGMYDDPVGMSDVNGQAVARILEAIRAVDVGIRLCQASSREIFGAAAETPQTEATLRNPRSPYGAAKLFADCLIRIYREHYGMFVCSAILFNHESPRRTLSFVSRKITHGAAMIKSGKQTHLRLGNLDARRDWGYAGDFVRAMWLMLQHSRADDYVICTEQSHSVRDFCEQAFDHVGLDYRKHVVLDQSSYRAAEPTLLVGSAAKAKRELGWAPDVEFRDLVHMMVDADLQTLPKENWK